MFLGHLQVGQTHRHTLSRRLLSLSGNAILAAGRTALDHICKRMQATPQECWAVRTELATQPRTMWREATH
jgi:hypothetical protein